MEIEQKPCPFCGSENISAGEASTTDRAGETVTQSVCMDCGACGPGAALGPDEVDYGDVKAVAAWNRRPLSATIKDIGPIAEAQEGLGEDDDKNPGGYGAEFTPELVKDLECELTDMFEYAFARGVEGAHMSASDLIDMHAYIAVVIGMVEGYDLRSSTFNMVTLGKWLDKFRSRTSLPVKQDVCAEMRALCSACGGTGDVHSIDGEWRGRCTCEQAAKIDGAQDAEDPDWPSVVMRSAHSLCPSELSHLDKMRWMGNYFLRNCAGATTPAPPVAEAREEQRARVHRKALSMSGEMPDTIGPPPVCDVPPPGWYCTRVAGHDGPCAAIPVAGDVGGIDTPEFCDLITELDAGHEEVSPARSKAGWAALTAHIDAKLAEAREAGYIKGLSEGYDGGHAQGMRETSARLQDRAEKAKAQLAAQPAAPADQAQYVEVAVIAGNGKLISFHTGNAALIKSGASLYVKVLAGSAAPTAPGCAS